MPGETIKERIDQDKNNCVDINEINKFIFDETEWEKNLNDLWNYLNELPLFNRNEIRLVINCGFYDSNEWKEIQQDILKKVSENKPLNKKELSLIYLEMLADNFRVWKLSDDQLKFGSDKPIDQICNWKLIQFIRTKYLFYLYTGDNSWPEWSEEMNQKWWDKISEDMFQQLLTMEGSQWYVSQIQSKNFWEKFPTWPYGMVYKHIDKNGNLLQNPTPFRNWERVTKERALDNAKAYYDKRAQEWKDLLDKNWYEYNQAQLDSLVSASWWTAASIERLQNFVLSHREKPAEISNFMSTFATKSAWNGQTQPWLVIRRQFESNWFNWIQKPFEEYQREYLRKRSSEKKNNPKLQQRPRKRRR